MIILLIAVSVLTLICVGCVIACLLVWRGCMKMYTEYFKERAISARTKGGQGEQRS